MDFTIRFNEEKNELLKSTRGISFEEVITLIKSGGLLDDRQHQSPHRFNQRIYIIKINNYAYIVPYVISTERNEIFLKTIYPSRVFTKMYLKGA